MAEQYWIVKQEPADYAWADFVRDGSTAWTGVRNFQARNYLRAMRRGDCVGYYHSGKEKRLVGLARVERGAYPDPTATEGDWVCVDLSPLQALREPVSLARIRQDPALAGLAFLRQSRLSVTPAAPALFRRLLALAKTSLP